MLPSAPLHRNGSEYVGGSSLVTKQCTHLQLPCFLTPWNLLCCCQAQPINAVCTRLLQKQALAFPPVGLKLRAMPAASCNCTSHFGLVAPPLPLYRIRKELRNTETMNSLRLASGGRAFVSKQSLKSELAGVPLNHFRAASPHDQCSRLASRPRPRGDWGDWGAAPPPAAPRPRCALAVPDIFLHMDPCLADKIERFGMLVLAFAAVQRYKDMQLSQTERQRQEQAAADELARSAAERAPAERSKKE